MEIAVSGVLPSPPKTGTWASAGVSRIYIAVSRMRNIPEYRNPHLFMNYIFSGCGYICIRTKNNIQNFKLDLNILMSISFPKTLSQMCSEIIL
jgi:hypothetical protein